MRMVGDTYAGAAGGPTDSSKAREWYEKAAAAGDADASKALASLKEREQATDVTARPSGTEK